MPVLAEAAPAPRSWICAWRGEMVNGVEQPPSSGGGAYSVQSVPSSDLELWRAEDPWNLVPVASTDVCQQATADETPPVLSLPQGATAEATGASGAVVSYVATAHDAVYGDTPVECTPASGSTFALGTTIVTCTSSDPRGNTATGSFGVEVVDTTPPALQLPDPIAAQTSDAAGLAIEFTATAFDLVAGIAPVSCTPPSGSVFAPGSHVVTCTATDGINTAQGSFTVDVTWVPPPSAQLDDDFGAGGLVDDSLVGVSGEMRRLATDSQGRFYVRLRTVDALIRRYLPNGSIDPSWGSNGTASISAAAAAPIASANNPYIVDLAVDAQDRLVVGIQVHGYLKLVARVLRMNASGTGIEAASPIFDYADSSWFKATGMRAIALLADGSIVAAMYFDRATSGSNYNYDDIALVKLAPSLQLVSGFGDGSGRLVLDVANAQRQDTPNDLLALPDGGFLLSMQSYGIPGNTQLVARFDANGTQDMTYGLNGVASVLSFTGGGALLPSGSGVVVQARGWSADPFVQRLDATGQPTPFVTHPLPPLATGESFDGNGITSSLALGDGTYVSVGVRRVPDGAPVEYCDDWGWGDPYCYTWQPTRPVLALYRADVLTGTLVTGFGDGGLVDLTALGLPAYGASNLSITQVSGGVLVVGEYWSAATGSQRLGIARLEF